MATRRKQRDPFLPVRRMIRGSEKWALDIPADVAGERVRSIFDLELLALEEGQRLRDQIRSRGIESLAQPQGVTLAALARMFVEYKTPRTGARNLYLLKNYLDDLVAFFDEISPAGVTGLRLEGWFSRESWAPGSRVQAFAYARMFFNWAERHDFIEKNPARRCEPPAKGEQKNHCLPVREWQALVKFTGKDPALRGVVCLGLFAGLRTIEIQRLDWSAVKFTDKEIHVSPATAKQTTGIKNRYVPMTPAFLAHCPRDLSGPVVDVTEKNFRLWRGELRAVMAGEFGAGWSHWPENCLRDTFASNDLAICEDAGKTAYRMGHSDSRMVSRVYARAVKRADAEKWQSGALK